MVDLTDAVDELEKWEDGKAVLLCGVGDTFCSGGDLRFMKQIATGELGMKMALLMHDTLTRLRDLPLISATLINGKALGGGAELLLSTDYRIGCRDVSIGFVHTRLQVIPGWGGVTRLVKLIGRTNALQLLSTARIIQWKEALYMGLLNTVLPEVEEGQNEAEQNMANALSWLQKHTAAEPSTIHAVKRAVSYASDNTLTDSLEYEREQLGSVWGGPAHMKALAKGQKHK